MSTYEEAQAEAELKKMNKAKKPTYQDYKEAALEQCRKGHHGTGNYGFGVNISGKAPGYHHMTIWCNHCQMSFECKSFDTPQAEVHAEPDANGKVR